MIILKNIDTITKQIPTKTKDVKSTSVLETKADTSQLSDLKKSLESTVQEYNTVKDGTDYESQAFYKSKIDDITATIKKVKKTEAKVAQTKVKTEEYQKTNDYKLMTELADKVGYKINLVEDSKDINGYVDASNNTITVNLNNIDNTKTGLNITSHEVLHTLKK